MILHEDIFGEMLAEPDRDEMTDDRWLIRAIGVYNSQVRLAEGRKKQNPIRVYLVYDLDRQTYLGYGGYVMNPEDDIVRFEESTVGEFELSIDNRRYLTLIDDGVEHSYILDEEIRQEEYVEFWYRPE